MTKLSLLNVRGMNWYTEDAAGAPLNTHLVTESSKLPNMSENMETFTPAATNGAIAIPLNREELEIGIVTKGLQPQLLRQFSAPYGTRRKYTGFGALVNEYGSIESERIIPVVATAYGRLGAEPDEHNGTSLMGTNYSIKSISKYVLTIGNMEICRFNIELGGWVDYEGMQAQLAAALGING